MYYLGVTGRNALTFIIVPLAGGHVIFGLCGPGGLTGGTGCRAALRVWLLASLGLDPLLVNLCK